MRKTAAAIFAAVMLAAMAAPALATNGTNIIGVGTISRSMGGVGVAAPQDAITAVFGNPAAMCYIPCETSAVDFAGTVFDPTIRAKVTTPAGTFEATSQGAPYAFPAIGIYTPISENLRFGLGAYGVSGLGVDYKDTDLGGAFGPGDAGIKTDLQIMKFAPNLAYRITPNLSVGAAVQINWAALDLGDGSGHNFGVGTQVGVIYRPIEPLTLGLTYQSPQKHTFKRIFNFNADLNGDGDSLDAGEDTSRDRLALEQPQHVAVGVAYEVIPKMVLVELNGKWYNWENADGYGADDFDWEDQYVVAVGLQVKPIDKVAIRLGYNYGNNPVKEHNGWNPAALKDIQGTNTSNPQYEYFRVVGFPAIVEHHVTAGIGIDISPKASLNIGYMHAFNHGIKETSAGGAFQYESSLRESSYEFGLNLRF